MLNWQPSDIESHWISRNDDEFKFHLDRYKYPNRYDDVDSLTHREQASIYLNDLNNYLTEMNISISLNDVLFPFVRQFANHDREWFDSQSWSEIHDWLSSNLESSEFKTCMKKYKQWHQGDEPSFFPIIG